LKVGPCLSCGFAIFFSDWRGVSSVEVGGNRGTFPPPPPASFLPYAPSPKQLPPWNLGPLFPSPSNPITSTCVPPPPINFFGNLGCEGHARGRLPPPPVVGFFWSGNPGQCRPGGPLFFLHFFFSLFLGPPPPDLSMSLLPRGYFTTQKTPFFAAPPFLGLGGATISGFCPLTTQHKATPPRVFAAGRGTAFFRGSLRFFFLSSPVPTPPQSPWMYVFCPPPTKKQEPPPPLIFLSSFLLWHFNTLLRGT